LITAYRSAVKGLIVCINVAYYHEAIIIPSSYLFFGVIQNQLTHAHTQGQTDRKTEAETVRQTDKTDTKFVFYVIFCLF
jgi:uncharacterized protein YpmB